MGANYTRNPTWVLNGPPAIAATPLNRLEDGIVAVDNAKADRFVVQATKVSNFTAGPGKYYPVDTTSGAITATLPNAPADGSQVAIRVETFGAGHNVTIQAQGVDVFDGPTPETNVRTLSMVGQMEVYQYALGVWYPIAGHIPLAGLDARYAGGGGGGGASFAIANNLSELPDNTARAAARSNLGLGTAATQPSTAFDPAGAATAAQAASAPAGAVLLGVESISTSGGGSVQPGYHNPYDATAGALGETLADAPSGGLLVSIEKTDSSANAVTITARYRGSGSTSTISLSLPHETIYLISAPDGTWWPVAGHKTLSSLDTRYALPAVSGNAGKRLATDGTSLAWEVASPDTWVPGDNNLLGSSINPHYPSSAASTVGTGKIMVARIKWNRTKTVQTLYTWIHTAGASLTAGQNLMALYTGAGAKIAGTTSTDQSTAWLSTGLVTEVLGSGVSIPADPTGFILAAVLVKGTTPPVFRGTATGTQLANVGLSAGTTGLAFWQDASTGNTAMPSSITPSTGSTSNAWFFAVGA